MNNSINLPAKVEVTTHSLQIFLLLKYYAGYY